MKLLLAIAMIGLFGCGRERQDRYVKDRMRFVKHPATGLCFAFTGIGRAATLANVPCSTKVLNLID